MGEKGGQRRTPAVAPHLLEFRNVGKSFGANRVLHDVSFDVREGEVHILAGENGAGKSTLVKILAGIHTRYDGEVALRGRPVRFANPHEATAAGIAVIHQELSLIDSMSVADNIHLGHESVRAGGILDRRLQARRAVAICKQLDLPFTAADVERPVEEFPLSIKNQIEIAKALATDGRILVMDEPTSALNRAEVEKLFAVIKVLRTHRWAIIYITHKMEEIYRLADRITVLRDGRWIGTETAKECPEPKLIQWMIGRDLGPAAAGRSAPAEASGAPPAFEIRNLEVPHPLRGRPPAIVRFSVKVRPGEVVGVAGLQGSGATELFQGLFGIQGPICRGEVRLSGTPFVPRSPRLSIARGLGYLTGDRKASGIVPGMSVVENMTLASLERTSPGGLLRPEREAVAAARRIAALGIRLGSPDQAVGVLSGGNQQKVIIARWLEARPTVLLLEEPTRGIDIGAKSEIYSLMREWTAAGMAILLISTELPELQLLSDRILVLHRGAVTAAFDRSEATPEKILAAAMGAAGGDSRASA
jgi:ABC-type sugar transport system ATPase subunit